MLAPVSALAPVGMRLPVPVLVRKGVEQRDAGREQVCDQRQNR
jgi:hypothetical protein